jgi:hypothetical protein
MTVENSTESLGYNLFELYCNCLRVQFSLIVTVKFKHMKKTPWLESDYTERLSDRRLSAKLVPTLEDRGCHVVSAAIPPQSLISVF